MPLLPSLRRIAAHLAAIAALLMLASVGGSQADAPPLKNISQSVVNIFTFDEAGGSLYAGMGSGSIISRDGYIATNNHVVTTGPSGQQFKSRNVRVFLDGDTVPLMPNTQNAAEWIAFKDAFDKGMPAQILYFDANRDLAILKTTGIPETPIVIARTAPDQGEPVYAVGYPGVAQEAFASRLASPTITNGTVGRTYTSNNGGSMIRLIQHSAGINHGNSGGPLIDQCQRLVGVNTWSPAEQSQSIFYATDANELIAMLEENNISANIVDTPCEVGGGYSAFYLGGLGLLAVLLALALAVSLRRPRVALVAAVNRSVDAVSRRVSGGGSVVRGAGGKRVNRASDDGKTEQQPRRAARSPDATERLPSSDGTFRVLHFKGRRDAARLSFEAPREMLQRTRNGAVMGRMAGSVDLLIDNDEISRRHARIFLDGRKVMLEDLGAMNGTQVDGLKLLPNMPAQIKDGSTVKLGPLTFDVAME